FFFAPLLFGGHAAVEVGFVCFSGGGAGGGGGGFGFAGGAGGLGGDRVDVFAFEALVRVLAAFDEGFFGWAAGEQAVAAVADQVGSAGGAEGFADFEVVFRLKELQQGPLELAVAELLRHVDRLFGERVDARVVHGRRHVERGGYEV